MDFNYLDDDEFDYEEDDCDDYDYDYGADTSEKDFNLVLAAKFDDIDLPTGVEAPVPWLKNPAAEEPKKNKKIIIEDEIDVNYKSFKQFDTVREHSDHYFSRPELLKTVPTVKKINVSTFTLRDDNFHRYGYLHLPTIGQGYMTQYIM